MCLIQNKLKYTGNKRITCYKVLEPDLISPYQEFQYVLNHKYNTLLGFYNRRPIFKEKINWNTCESVRETSFSSDSFFNNIKAVIDYHRNKDYQMVTNGFHSLRDLDDVKNLKKDIDYLNFKKNIIVKCIIPEYTWYYTGYFGFGCSGYSGYASESIIIEEIL